MCPSRTLLVLLLASVVTLSTGCTSAPGGSGGSSGLTESQALAPQEQAPRATDGANSTAGLSPVESSTTSTVAPAPSTTSTALGKPAWLGTRILPLRPDGFGEVLPTPPELVDRKLPTIDVLPLPIDGFFASTASPVPQEVVERSTWSEECPVALDELSYLTVSFWGFDGDPHTGEMLVNAAVSDQLISIFRDLYLARFPIEEMRVVPVEELALPPTGDGNNTTSFVCRQVTAGSGWSQHAYGLAVDINPFQNPYQKGDLVVPELASAYLDRTDVRPGMILDGDDLTTAMGDLGWAWGGAWSTLTDPMHFSRDGG